MSKILITGASGFVGQHLLEDISSGDFHIRIMTRHPEKKMRIIPAGCEIVQGDLNDAESLKKALQGIEILVNTAAEVRDPAKLSETNINGTKNLISAIIENKVPKVIHLSSVGVVGMQYSSKPIVIDEQSACFPKNEYERTKLESERLLIEAGKQHNFQLTILRPTNVYGEFHPFNALLNFMQHVNAGKSFFCSSQAMVNYVYVKDLTALMIRFMNDNKEYGIVNTGPSQSLRSFAETLAKSFHKKISINSIPQILVNFSEALGVKKLHSVSNSVIYSDEKLRSFFNYPYGIEKGLTRTIDYYKQQQLLK